MVLSKYPNKNAHYTSLCIDLWGKITNGQKTEDTIRLIEQAIQKMNLKYSNILTADLPVDSVDEARLIALYFTKKGYKPELSLKPPTYSVFVLGIPFLTEEELNQNREDLLKPL